MPKKNNAQAALAAAVRSTNPGLSNTTQNVLKSANTYKAWLDENTPAEEAPKEDTPAPQEGTRLSRAQQAKALKDASKIGLSGYVDGETAPHIPEMTLEATLNFLRELHNEGFEIAKRGDKK